MVYTWLRDCYKDYLLTYRKNLKAVMFASSEIPIWEMEKGQCLGFRFDHLRDHATSPNIARLNEFLS